MINNINDIKQSIVRSSELIENGVPKKLNQIVNDNTNCYAYALGITSIRVLCLPGFTERVPYKRFNKDEFTELICKDLENLEIKFRKIGLEEKIILNENEYLIKSFLAKHTLLFPKGDFHFIRKDNESGLWFDKMGCSKPKLVNKGLEPMYIYSRTSGLYYDPVSYFAITQKN